MIMFSIAIFLFGLVLSAFFSGSETGLYRVSRTRLVLDALDGSPPARAMIWLINRPTIFVATTLVGNNIANFLTSFAIVMLVGELFGASSTAELIGPMLMTPIVFVFGELLPKYWFFQAPYRLLNLVSPLILLATVVFLPVSMVLAGLSILLSLVTGQTPLRLRLAMARGEFMQILRAGEEAGVLHSGQRSLVEQLFDTGSQMAISYAVPLDRLATVDMPLSEEEANRARRQNHPIVLVRNKKRIVGYVRYSELATAGADAEVRPVIRESIHGRHLKVLLRLYDAASEVALLCDDHDNTQSVVTRRQLLQPMIK
ncbi:CNNM domain-containing protein [Stieleria sp. JC731]|uniref:CNNM domain-containing protein n=1 Tax=Pirellulaceae TaxID=2691357 RepID=UPI001E62C230|nr:CNNM domain-containing protein [Stieleria sp. JC731]MCC9599803.1 CNNM domain-containing protein [Stieleria sp. JC731]